MIDFNEVKIKLNDLRSRHNSDDTSEDPKSGKSRHGSGASSRFATLFRKSDKSSLQYYEKLIKSMNPENLNEKMNLIEDYMWKDEDDGNTLMHVAATSGASVEVFEELFKRGTSLNAENIRKATPMLYILDLDNVDLCKWMLSKEPGLANEDHFRWAYLRESCECLKLLYERKPCLLDKKHFLHAQVGFLQYYHSLKQPRTKDYEFKNEYFSKMTVNDRNEYFQLHKVEDRKTGAVVVETLKKNDVLDFLIEVTSDDLTINVNEQDGGILHCLVRLNYHSGISAFMSKLSSKEQEEVLSMRDHDNKTPFFNALDCIVDNFKAAMTLLDFGADPNDNLKPKHTIANGDTNAVIGSASDQVTAIEYLFSKKWTYQRKKALALVERILPVMTDLENSIKHALAGALDDRFPSLTFLRMILGQLSRLTLEQRRKVLRDVNAVHKIVCSQLHSITDELDLLFQNGAQILDQTTTKEFDGPTYPVQMAAYIQDKYNCPNEESRDYAKHRLTQYLACVRLHGFDNFIHSVEDRVAFLRSHLTAAVYDANYHFLQDLLRDIHKVESASKDEIIHYTTSKGNVYHKPALYWASKQKDQIILGQIVKLEADVHAPERCKNTKDAKGIECFKNLKDVPLQQKATRLYLDLCLEKKWYKNCGPAIKNVLFLKIILFIVDIVLDVRLMQSYAEQGYFTAWWISFFLMVPSFVAYLVTSWFFFNGSEYCKNHVNPDLYKYLGWLLNPFILPFAFLQKHVAADTRPSNSNSMQLEDYKFKWMLVRRIECAIEGAGQLILQLWVFKIYFATITSWTSKELFQHFWAGLGSCISLGNYYANFVEEMIGKVFISCISICFAITSIKTEKPSGTNIVGKLLVFSGCACQITARLMTFSLYMLVICEKYVCLLCFFHILLEFFLKVFFEWPRFRLDIESNIHSEETPISQQNGQPPQISGGASRQMTLSLGRLKEIINTNSRFLLFHLTMLYEVTVTSFCGSLIYLNINTDLVMKLLQRNIRISTFWPFTLHIVICFIQHIVIICLLPSNQNNSLTFVVLPFILLILACVSNALYYKLFHPISLLNNPAEGLCECDQSREDLLLNHKWCYECYGGNCCRQQMSHQQQNRQEASNEELQTLSSKLK